VDAYPDERFSGSVSQIRLQPVVEQNVVSYVTVIDVPNAELKLKPGMTATVTIEIARADDVLRVPTSALRFQPPAELLATLGGPSDVAAGGEPPLEGGADGSAGRQESTKQTSRPNSHTRGRVWVLRDGRLVVVPVRVGTSDGARTAVEGRDLVEGDQVVTGVTDAPAAAQPTTSPLLPFGGRRGGGAGERPATPPATGSGR
jgi:HlyD family secretion protein